MNASGEKLAPEVQSILDAARSRPGGDTRVDVSARSFPDAVAATDAAGRVPVVAEVKPTSPTTEGERDDDPVELAAAMVAGGATALSVLTEPDHFGGSTERLERIRQAVDVPVLRKDFVVHEGQLDAVAADLVLLIARFLDAEGTASLSALYDAAEERGFQPLVEVHTREELARALDIGAEIIGINNRDLAKLDVDLGTFERLAPAVPDDVTLVAESGIATGTQVRRMREAGADALLIGTAIMHGDVQANTERLTTVDGAAAATDRPADTNSTSQ
jgi:indole-3-glycerol phosphate synthase